MQMTPKDMVGRYFQVSRKYRTVASLPEGETGIQALTRARLATYDFEELDLLPPPSRGFKSVGAYWRWKIPKWAKLLGEGPAGDQYLRVYASKEGRCVHLSQQDFDAFRKAGGSTYSVAHSKHKGTSCK